MLGGPSSKRIVTSYATLAKPSTLCRWFRYYLCHGVWSFRVAIRYLTQSCPDQCTLTKRGKDARKYYVPRYIIPDRPCPHYIRISFTSKASKVASRLLRSAEQQTRSTSLSVSSRSHSMCFKSSLRTFRHDCGRYDLDHSNVRGVHGPAKSAEVSGDTAGSDANGWLGTGSPLMKMQTVHHVGKRSSRV